EAVNDFRVDDDVDMVTVSPCQVNKIPYKLGSHFILKPHGSKENQKVKEETRENQVRDIVTREVLSRLPVKSLMRFKCVCKHWLFLIQEDPSFIALHLEHSKARPGLLITNSIALKDTFLIADLLLKDADGVVSSAVVRTLGDINPYNYDVMLKSLNGLIGFFGVLRDPGIGIYNLSTREGTPWIKSAVLRKLLKEDRGAYERPWLNCTMGYDPSSKKHKVVGIWKSMQPCYVVCEVLTVGEDNWRKIDDLPPYDIAYYGSEVYLNGSIYYLTQMLSIWGSYCNNEEPKFIVAFNVASEKFTSIRVPNISFGMPSDDLDFIYYSVQLLDLNGQLGLFAVASGSDYAPKLWLFNNDGKNKKNKTSAWTEVLIEIPLTFDKGLYPVHPIPGTNHILLTPNSDIPSALCYSYNWITKNTNQIEMEGLPSSVPCFSSSSRNAIYFESLLPVQNRAIK
ncbi:hypothetical protein MKW92_026628, partial [Papaver armeniacum]